MGWESLENQDTGSFAVADILRKDWRRLFEGYTIHSASYFRVIRCELSFNNFFLDQPFQDAASNSRFLLILVFL